MSWIKDDESGWFSPQSALATPTADTTPPDAPTELIATPISSTSVLLAWAENSDPDLAGYNVYRSTTSGVYGSPVNGSLLTGTSFLDGGLVQDTPYFYVVTAVDDAPAANESADSNEATATPTDTTPPAAPVNLVATAGDAEVTLDWGDNTEPDLDGYNILRSQTFGSGYVQINGSLQATSDYTDSTALNDTEYFYVVRAADTTGNESANSNQDSATPTAALPSITVPALIHSLDTRVGSVHSSTYENLAWLHDHSRSEEGTRRIRQPGRCYGFSGSSQKVYNIATASWSTSAGSLSIWLNRPNNSQSWVLMLGSSTGFATNGISLICNSSSWIPEFVVDDRVVGQYAVGDLLPTDEWHHLCGVWDGSTVKIYQNGVETDSVSYTGPGTITHGDGWIGGDGTYYEGHLHDARQYNDALTPAEVLEIAGMKPGSRDVGPLDANGWWPLEEVSGTGAGACKDVSGNGNDGTSLSVTFNTTLNDVFSFENEFGYTEVTPGTTHALALPNDVTEDTDGNTTEFQDQAPHDSTLSSPCVTLSGVNQSINFGDLTTAEPAVIATELKIWVKLLVDNQEILTLQNSTASAITVVAGTLTYGGALTVSATDIDGTDYTSNLSGAGALLNDNEWHELTVTLTAISVTNFRVGMDSNTFGNIAVHSIRLSADPVGEESGAEFEAPCCEGSGDTIHDTGGERRHGTLSETTGVWANTQNNRDVLVRDGYRYTGSTTIPVEPNTGVAASGDPRTHGPGVLAPGQSLDLTGGEANAPVSTLLTSLLTSTTYTQGDGNDGDILFIRQGDDGEDRLQVFEEALTGADLTAMNADVDAPPAIPPPAAPTGLSATPGNAEVDLDWDDNSEPALDGYNVYRSLTMGGPYTLLNVGLVALSAYTDSTAANGTTYYYVVTAVDTDANESTNSFEENATPALPTELVVHLALNESSGTNAPDISGNGNNGTLTNGAVFEALSGTEGDSSSHAVRFDGTDDYIDLGTPDVSGSGVTVTCFFKADAFAGVAEGRLVAKADGGAANSHIFMLSTDLSGANVRLRARVRISGTTTTLVATSGNLVTDTWYHAALAYDGTNLKLYLDGTEVGTTPLTGAVDTDAALDVTVGGQPSAADRYFDGLIDDVRIIERGLTQQEIQDIVGDIDPPPPTTGHYVSVNGTPGANGGINDPWDIITAFGHPAAVDPGDTIYLRGGTYSFQTMGITTLTSSLTGTAVDRIKVRNYPGEHAIIDGWPGAGQKGRISWYGSYTDYMEFEITDTGTGDRVSDQGGNWVSDVNIATFDSRGDHQRFIGLILHDLMNVGFWRTNPTQTGWVEGGELHGCIIYNIGMWGWSSGNEGSGDYTLRAGWDHGLYSQNDGDTKYIQNNLFLNTIGLGTQLWSSGGSEVNDFHVSGNLWAMSGAGVGIGSGANEIGYARISSVTVGAVGKNLHDNIFSNNYAMHDPDNSQDAKGLWHLTSYGSSFTNFTIEDNYAQGIDMLWNNSLTGSTVSGNTLVGGASTGAGAPGAGISTPASDTGQKVFVHPNSYIDGRGHVVVFNHDDLSSVSVDLSAVLSNGDQFEIYHAYNLQTPVTTGTYSGANVTIPLADTTSPTPNGDLDRLNPKAIPGEGFNPYVMPKKFGAFLVKLA